MFAQSTSILNLIMGSLLPFSFKQFGIFSPIFFSGINFSIKLAIPIIFFPLIGKSSVDFDSYIKAIFILFSSLFLFYFFYKISGKFVKKIRMPYFIFSNPPKLRLLYFIFFAISVLLIVSRSAGFSHYTSIAFTTEFGLGVARLIKYSELWYGLCLVLIFSNFLHSSLSFSMFFMKSLPFMFIAIYVGSYEGGRSILLLPLFIFSFVYFSKNYVKKRYLITFILLIILLVILSPTSIYKQMKMEELQLTSLVNYDYFYHFTDSLYHLMNLGVHTVMVVNAIDQEPLLNTSLNNFLIDYDLGQYFAYIIYGSTPSDGDSLRVSASFVGELYFMYGWVFLFLLLPIAILIRIFTDRFYIYFSLEPFNYILRLFFLIQVVWMFWFFSPYSFLNNLIRESVLYLIFIFFIFGVPKLRYLSLR